jgi:hypothetical protein
MEVSQDLISAVRQLYQRQEELGWQPKIDIKDTPESTELAAQA